MKISIEPGSRHKWWASALNIQKNYSGSSLLVLADCTKYPLVTCLRHWLSAFLAHFADKSTVMCLRATNWSVHAGGCDEKLLKEVSNNARYQVLRSPVTKVSSFFVSICSRQWEMPFKLFFLIRLQLRGRYFTKSWNNTKVKLGLYHPSLLNS